MINLAYQSCCFVWSRWCVINQFLESKYSVCIQAIPQHSSSSSSTELVKLDHGSISWIIQSIKI